MTHPFEIGGLGEIAIRCVDIDEMTRFYRDIIGLKVMSDGRDSSGIVFFRVSSGVAGHICVLALFRHDVGRAELHQAGDLPPNTGANSSLHHLALSLTHAEQDKAIAFYQAKGVEYVEQVFDWIGWRGVFTKDPDGNTVELVAFDRRYLKNQ